MTPRQLLLARREPNTAPNIEGLIEDWLAGRPSRAQGETRISAAGNRNLTGSEGVQPALDLTPFDPRWDEAIEPRVRPLVAALVDAGFISYTSCGGHRRPTGPGPASFAHLSVGLLPQSPDQAACLCRLLGRAADRLTRHSPGLRLVAYRTQLRSEVSGKLHSTIDLDLVPVASAPEAYFAQLDRAMAELTSWWFGSAGYDMRKEVITVAEQSDFAGFLSELETGEDENMATAHHSAVNVREWADKAASTDEDG